MQRKQTPSQTVGPYFAIGLVPQQLGFDYPGVVNVKLDESAPGKHIVISGQVVDGERAPVNDAMLEFWQADARGDYPRAAGTRAGANQYFSSSMSSNDDAGASPLIRAPDGPA